MAVQLVWSNEQEQVAWQDGWEAMLERLLQAAASREGIAEGEVALTIVDDEAIRALNKDYRGLDKPTDVLSFSMLEQTEEEEAFESPEPGLALLGDIVISLETAQRQAEEYGHSLERELGFLFVHGFLHIVGHDHGDEEAERLMFALQEDILTEAGLGR